MRPLLDRFLPADASLLDAIAFAWFISAWATFNLVQDHLLHRGVNEHLIVLRRRWMERMLERDVRIPDTMLLGHSMQSCTFFASTTVLVLAGLVGSFGAADHAHQMLSGLGFTVQTSLALFQAKLMVLGGIFIFAFFKFTWALRQFNYCVALLGSVPNPPVSKKGRKVLAGPIAGMLSLALAEFNSGIRAYYLALAALTWMIDPKAFIVATAGVLLVLGRRQIASRAERLLRQQIVNLDDMDEPMA